ncbi:hypothetical protein AGMMS49975_15490 [Clostridia bacterium]|nr:hypothetical protein AGMMS49975_15490 [Clostridia bacterium]
MGRSAPVWWQGVWAGSLRSRTVRGAGRARTVRGAGVPLQHDEAGGRCSASGTVRRGQAFRPPRMVRVNWIVGLFWYGWGYWV